MSDISDREYMLRALEMANKAYALEEVPVGALIVKDGDVIVSVQFEGKYLEPSCTCRDPGYSGSRRKRSYRT